MQRSRIFGDYSQPESVTCASTLCTLWVAPNREGLFRSPLPVLPNNLLILAYLLKKLLRTFSAVRPWWRVRNPPRVFSISFLRTYSRGHRAMNLHISSGASHDCPELRSSSAFRSLLGALDDCAFRNFLLTCNSSNTFLSFRPRSLRYRVLCEGR